MLLKKNIQRIKRLGVDSVRKFYHVLKRTRLKNSCPTIISRNCVGGIIYHDLGLKFNSPTINLSMSNDDYIKFVEHLDSFVGESKNTTLTEVREKLNYPVGELKNGEISILIEFVHYISFEEAKAKWFERSKRVDYKNIYIIWEVSKDCGPDEELWRRFKSLKYANKVLITGNNFPVSDKDIYKMQLYDQGYYYGKLLEYKKGFQFYKRYLDDFDYVSFLNKG